MSTELIDQKNEKIKNETHESNNDYTWGILYPNNGVKTWVTPWGKCLILLFTPWVNFRGITVLKNNLIAPELHGFVMYKSCTTYLLETFDIITQAIHSNSLVYLIFLDFAKAFDKVCHNSLIIKFKALGFDEMISSWIKDFLLSFRKQGVVIGNSYSSWRNVQDSVLGPLLFFIFINDMLKVAQHLLKLFADGSKLIGIIKNLDNVHTIQTDIDALVHLPWIWTTPTKSTYKDRNLLWSPYRQKEARTLEAVQRRATKLVPKLKNLKYEDRLKRRLVRKAM